jgi:hypothetical protein
MKEHKTPYVPKTDKEREASEKDLMKELTEGFRLKDMLLVAVRLDRKKDTTKVMATSMFEGRSEDILHLVDGMKQGTESLTEGIINQVASKMPPKLKDAIFEAMQRESCSPGDDMLEGYR